MEPGGLVLILSSVSMASLLGGALNRIRPINVKSLQFTGRTAKAADNGTPCPQDPPLPTTDRTEFGTQSCIIYGYPSTGGALIKQADPLDVLSLSLSCIKISFRSNDTKEEDDFCRLLLRTGATLLPSKESWHATLIGYTGREKTTMVYGWPSDGEEVWVLRFNRSSRIPSDLARARMAMSMEEKIEVIKEYNAIFVEGVSQVEKLHFGQMPSEPEYKFEEDEDEDDYEL